MPLGLKKRVCEKSFLPRSFISPLPSTPSQCSMTWMYYHFISLWSLVVKYWLHTAHFETLQWWISAKWGSKRWSTGNRYEIDLIDWFDYLFIININIIFLFYYIIIISRSITPCYIHTYTHETTAKLQNLPKNSWSAWVFWLVLCCVVDDGLSRQGVIVITPWSRQELFHIYEAFEYLFGQNILIHPL